MKKRLQHRFFAVNFVKFLRTALYIELLRWQLLALRNGCSEKKLKTSCITLKPVALQKLQTTLSHKCFIANLLRVYWRLEILLKK